ncbi:MAG: leucine-rich repeat protein [Tenericutes bacterium]|nr:leucine-rich repeat protein [Mycoplasmatota bacterium]
MNITNIIIPSTITTIESHAFGYNDIPSITIPSTVTTINKNAFYGNCFNMSATINNNSSSINITPRSFSCRC